LLHLDPATLFEIVASDVVKRVEVDDRLVTGQNPQSAAGVGLGLVMQLLRRKAAA